MKIDTLFFVINSECMMWRKTTAESINILVIVFYATVV